MSIITLVTFILGLVLLLIGAEILVRGALFVGYYVVYTLYLVLNATHHEALPLFSGIMWAFVLPLTAVTLLVIVARQLYIGRRARAEPS